MQKASSDDALRKQEALTYLRELKERLKNKKDTYDEFLEIMKEFKAQRIDTEGVIKRVKTIFRGHKDLILGFNQFLPKGHEIRVEDVEREEREEAERQKGAGGAAPKPQVEFVHAISYVNKIKTRFSNDESVYKAFLEILNMYRKNLKSISQVYEEVALLFKSHNDLLEEFTYFLPDFSTPAAGKKGARLPGRGKGGMGANKRKGKGEAFAPPPEPEEKQTAASLAKELAFFEKVKARLKDRNAYNELIKCLNIFNSEVISKMELQALVYEILGKHPDLHAGFSDFLGRCELMDFEFVEGSGKGPKDGKLSQKEMQKMKVMSAREKFLSKPISELDLTSCERCGPSYRLLPAAFPKAPASGRTPLCDAHLNDNWVSVTSGSEDYSFKAMRKNQYEEALFRCEDDRFELDMVLETTKATVEALEPIQAKIESLAPEQRATYRLAEGVLTPVHLRSIERLYGIGTDQGSDIRRMIQDYPAVTCPIVLARLREKEAEWKKVKTEVTPVWVDVYEKNYNKSLDHRSFYFKQTDKKALSAKGMTGEIKEASDKKKLSDEAVAKGGALATEKKIGGDPDLVFTYQERAVHDDVYAVLKFSAREMLNAKQADEVLKTWREVVEPFFAIVRKDPEGDYVDDAAERAAEDAKKKEEESLEEDDEKEDGDDADAAEDAEEENAEMDDDAPPRPENSSKNSDDEEEEEAPAVKKRKGGPGGKAGAKKRPKKEESDEDAEESDEDDEEEKVYAACTPLSGAVSTSAAVSAQSGGAHPLERTDGTRLFYCHDGYYMLFRLHQHLYERLSTARASAESMSKQFGQKAEPETVRAAKAREIHDEFLRLFFKLLNGQVESSSFEDDCRMLLGANSYVLFTLDKLVFKIVKQIQALAQDDVAAKLRRLAEYEKARGIGAFSEAVYHANASVLLMDEPCYRIGGVDKGAGLALQLVESGLDKSDLPAGTMEAQFHEYLEGFLHTAADDEDENTAPWQDLSDRPEVYLPRSKIVAGFVDENGEDTKSMGLVSVHNSLECKISCSNSKVSYVLDTEDVFFRRAGTGAGAKRGRGAEGKAFVASRAEKKAEKFQRWQAEKFAAMPPPEDEAAKAAKAEAEAVPDFATAAAAAMLTDVEAKEEAENEEDEEEEEGEEEAAEEGEGDDAAGDEDAAADEEMEDAEGGDE
uniref:Histone deacetylase interacting domain-containing protein n=1 Tax=Micromonas pusilla TaxID=38833 RepID=A0A7S0GW34_MICPS|mmetsp:Transcript_510/g.2094  ORF Transcript_510/g.2094 Transcript_510/m.2094 type:complete len:1166 (+) Transcript_510:215-3712(+)